MRNVKQACRKDTDDATEGKQGVGLQHPGILLCGRDDRCVVKVLLPFPQVCVAPLRAKPTHVAFGLGYRLPVRTVGG
jgi:hypothetical protein